MPKLFVVKINEAKSCWTVILSDKQNTELETLAGTQVVYGQGGTLGFAFIKKSTFKHGVLEVGMPLDCEVASREEREYEGKTSEFIQYALPKA